MKVDKFTVYSVIFQLPNKKMASEEKEEVSPGTTRKIFIDINEKQPQDIQLEVFYKPHTLSLLLVVISGLAM